MVVAASPIVIGETILARSRNDYLLTFGTSLGPVGAVSESIWPVSTAGKITRDHWRDYSPTTARASPTAVYHNNPLGWFVIAASPIVIGEGWLDARSRNDYLLTGGTRLGSIGAVV